MVLRLYTAQLWRLRGKHSFHSHCKVHSLVHCTQRPIKEEQKSSLCSCQLRMFLLITETLPVEME